MIVVVPVLVYALLVLFNWGPREILTEGHTQWVKVHIGLGYTLDAQIAELVGATLFFGLAVGALAMFVASSRRWAEHAAQIERLTADNRRLGAATRAMEAALPVLRERYDQATGATGPAPAASDDPADHVSIAQLALEDAAAKRAARERARGGR